MGFRVHGVGIGVQVFEVQRLPMGGRYVVSGPSLGLREAGNQGEVQARGGG